MNNHPKQTREVKASKLRELLKDLFGDLCAGLDTGHALGASTHPLSSARLRRFLAQILKNPLAGVCRSKKSAYLCSAVHLDKATESPTASAAGHFYGLGRRHRYSSVPCGALMRPLPCSRCTATGSGTFFVRIPLTPFIY